MTFLRFFRVNFLINVASKHLRMWRFLGGGLYFTFPSQVRRLLEGHVYKRAMFKRGNTVIRDNYLIRLSIET